ncbi:hypothetical protein R3X28_14985 [Maribacter sp. TH_r10]|uniref:hypothetical protein n=1 Tax=Maribacter sp. TH_r10 TaxID=3082086 RepID=UPI002954C0CC|nr:hypothetical protein [Maribacter sp. TH_r10]MDV7140195.1 hypothetical protein [Maribacter sp. TH_r10]
MNIIPWLNIKTIKSSGVLLRVILLLDVLFILGHVYTEWVLGGAYDLFLLDAKGFGFPEGFQYVKYIGVIGIITYLMGRKKRFAYLPLLVLFGFLLVDDIFQLHNQARWLFVHLLHLHSLFGVKASNLGLLAYTATMVVFFFGLCLWHYKSASEGTRKSFLDIFVLLGIFLFFAVGVDLVQSFFEGHRRIGFVLTVIEEGGEMVSLSFLVWYFYRLIRTPLGQQDQLWTRWFTKWVSGEIWQNNKATKIFKCTK